MGGSTMHLMQGIAVALEYLLPDITVEEAIANAFWDGSGIHSEGSNNQYPWRHFSINCSLLCRKGSIAHHLKIGLDKSGRVWSYKIAELAQPEINELSPILSLLSWHSLRLVWFLYSFPEGLYGFHSKCGQSFTQKIGKCPFVFFNLE